MAEFKLIERFAASGPGRERPDVVLGIGDDAAVVAPAEDLDLVCASATASGESAHEIADTPDTAAHRLMASACNRLAALGATPRWLTLAVTLPRTDEHWVDRFCTGLEALAHEHAVSLVGGDTTSGPVGVSLFLTGTARAREVTAPRPGDLVVTTGELGASIAATFAAGMAAELPARVRELAIRRHRRPVPRVDLTASVAEYASAAADLSDGLVAALESMCGDDAPGASIELGQVPLPSATRRLLLRMNRLPAALHASDCELCLCVPPDALAPLREAEPGTRFTVIGRLLAETGIRTIDKPRCV